MMNPIFNTPLGKAGGHLCAFEQEFETAILGAGLAGFAAVRSLIRCGSPLLWLEPTGDLLWECSRALETRLDTPHHSTPWEEWVSLLGSHQAVSHGHFDAATAEVLAARETTLARAHLTPLFHAVPVQAEMHDGYLTSLVIATRSGFKRVRARRWIDTSESGLLARLTGEGQGQRNPERWIQRLALQAPDWRQLDTALLDLLKRFPGTVVERSARESERLICFPYNQEEPWHRLNQRFAQALREHPAASGVFISHHALRPLPIYSQGTTASPSVRNLVVASPAWSPIPIETAGDRFALGVEALRRLASRPGYPGPFPSGPIPVPPITQEASCEVLVAGSGTAGAVSALAASREGAKTIALEQALFPGGIGSGGGISVYFYGASGGLQEEIDHQTDALSALYGSEQKPGSWHHDAKKFALWSLLEDAGVEFLGGRLLCGVEKDSSGRISSVLAAHDGTVTRYRANAFIDSTGDGDLAALAGAPFTVGRPGDARTLAYSQVSLYLTLRDEHWNIGLINFDAGWVDATDPQDLSRARLEGLALHFFPSWPVADRPFLLSPLLGVRQSRHFLTRDQVTLDHLISPGPVPHPIGTAKAIVDTHSVDFEFESDEVLFYLWICQAFHELMEAPLPYGMLLPLGLDNLWIACRAAGIEPDASYCVRMQRDIQRLGEAAGVAAALSSATGKPSHEIDFDQLRGRLQLTRALTTPPLSSPEKGEEAVWLAALDAGEIGRHLWHLSRCPSLHDAVAERLKSQDLSVSFLAAVILAFARDERGIPRLLQAIQTREEGDATLTKRSKGAFGQWIDIPRWLKAIALIRRVGGADCIPIVVPFVSSIYPHNVRTLAAITLEALAQRDDAKGRPELEEALTLLESPSHSDGAHLPPSRSLWKVLQGKPNGTEASWGLDLRQDHQWQLSLAAARLALAMGRPLPESAHRYQLDYRGYVRKAFALLVSKGTPPLQ